MCLCWDKIGWRGLPVWSPAVVSRCGHSCAPGSIFHPSLLSMLFSGTAAPRSIVSRKLFVDEFRARLHRELRSRTHMFSTYFSDFVFGNVCNMMGCSAASPTQTQTRTHTHTRTHTTAQTHKHTHTRVPHTSSC